MSTWHSWPNPIPTCRNAPPTWQPSPRRWPGPAPAGASSCSSAARRAVGKTAVLREFTAALEGTLWGACDPLFTPRPLGPFLDIAADAGFRFEAGTKPHQVASTLMRESWAQRGTVIVLEDLHWADEATLDVVSLLARRIESVPALVIASYRDDELARTHPLRRLLGELRGSSAIKRLSVEPLSPAGVASLAGAAQPASTRPRCTGPPAATRSS